jgi:hypothetical protein
MTWNELAGVMGSAGALLTPVAVIANILYTRSATKKINDAGEARGKVALAKIQEVQLATNGMHAEIVREVRASADAAGQKKGRSDEKEERARRDIEGGSAGPHQS